MTVWLPGYFTRQLHAVTGDADRMVFHGALIAWSMCGRVAVLDSADPREELAHCPRCVLLAGTSA